MSISWPKDLVRVTDEAPHLAICPERHAGVYQHKDDQSFHVAMPGEWWIAKFADMLRKFESEPKLAKQWKETESSRFVLIELLLRETLPK